MVYFITDGEFIKIGKAEKPIERMRKMQTANARELKILGVYECYDEELENYIHKRFSNIRVRGEWFRPSKELFAFMDYSITSREDFIERLEIHKMVNNSIDVSKEINLLENLAHEIIMRKNKLTKGNYLIGPQNDFEIMWNLENRMPEIFGPVRWEQDFWSVRKIFRR